MSLWTLRKTVLFLILFLLSVLAPVAVLLTGWWVRFSLATGLAALGLLLGRAWWRRTRPIEWDAYLRNSKNLPLSSEEADLAVKRLWDGSLRSSRRLSIRLLEKHGTEGLRVVLKGPLFKIDEYHPLGSIPKGVGCPWESLDVLSIPEAIATVWAPLASQLPRTVARLQSECRHMGVARVEGKWRLLYLLPFWLRDGDLSFTIHLGGAPNGDPRLPKESADRGWRLPAILRRFYAVHDGLEFRYDPDSCWRMFQVTSCEELRTLAAIPRGDKELPYDRADLLEFFPILLTGAHCFQRRSADDEDPPTVFWNMDTDQLQQELDGFALLDLIMIQLKDLSESEQKGS